MRTAIVTGGTRGIGRAITRALKAEGAHVVALYAGCEAEAEACRTAMDVVCLPCDVGDYAACADAVAKVADAFGKVDILVNNAGVTRDAALHKMTAQDWETVIRTDLTGVFNMTRQVIGGMRERGFGRIVNISSVNGQKGQFGQTNYCAAKAGMIGFTKALALETARCGVTVNAVAPGYIDTAMVAALEPEVLEAIRKSVPVQRLGTVDEVARCVAFLASEDSGFITGATLAVNGGLSMVG